VADAAGRPLTAIGNKGAKLSVSYFVRYEGEAESPEAFLSYYRDRHGPILARFPGIRRIVLHIPAAWNDPFPVKPDRFALLAQMEFETAADLEAALHSSARAAARDDFAGFPPFHGTVYHQAATSEEVFVR
jgi:uncharacterized protein (TIGR02118 family)